MGETVEVFGEKWLKVRSLKRSRIWIFRARRRTFQRRSESERKVWLIAERSSPETGRWGGAERNGMVIVASQRLEPEGLGTLLRKPETGRNLLKAVGGEERAGSWFYPSLWSPKPVLLPCNKLDRSPDSKGPFPWHSLCNGSRTWSKMRDQHQTLGGEPGGYRSGLARWQRRSEEGGVRGTKRRELRDKYCKGHRARTWSDKGGNGEGTRSEFPAPQRRQLDPGRGVGGVSEEPERPGRLPKNPAALQSSLHLWLQFVKDIYVAIIVLEKYTKKWYHSALGEKWVVNRQGSVCGLSLSDIPLDEPRACNI